MRRVIISFLIMMLFFNTNVYACMTMEPLYDYSNVIDELNNYSNEEIIAKYITRLEATNREKKMIARIIVKHAKEGEEFDDSLREEIINYACLGYELDTFVKIIVSEKDKEIARKVLDEENLTGFDTFIYASPDKDIELFPGEYRTKNYIFR